MSSRFGLSERRGSKKLSPEVQAFQRGFSILIEAVQTPVVLAAQLYSGNIISKTVLDELLTTNGISKATQNIRLLSAVDTSLKLNPACFEDILNIFEKSDALISDQASQLKNSYDALRQKPTVKHQQFRNEHETVNKEMPADELTDSSAPPPQQGNYNIIAFQAQHNATKITKYRISVHSQLMEAIYYGNDDQVSALFKSEDVDVNFKNNTGITFLMLAAENGHVGIAVKLLTADAHPNIQNQFGKTALILATWKGHTAVMKPLLTFNADTDIQERRKGRSALFFAAERGNLTNVKLLLDYSADCTIKDKDGKTAYDIAKLNGYEDIAMMLSKHTSNESAQCAVVDNIEPCSTQTVESTEPCCNQQVESTDPCSTRPVDNSAPLSNHPVESGEHCSTQPVNITEDTVTEVPTEPEQIEAPSEESTTENIMDLLQLTDTLNSRWRDFDDHYISQAYRQMFGNPEDAPYIPFPKRSQRVSSEPITLFGLGDDELYS